MKNILAAALICTFLLLFDSTLASPSVSSVKSLGLYKGSVNDLLPDKVGNRQKLDRRLGPGYGPGPLLGMKTLLDKLRVTEHSSATYKSPDDAKVDIWVINFTSLDEANEGLKFFREDHGDPRFEDKYKDGTKSSGGTVIGKRFELESFRKDGTKRRAAVAWTNGSVLFMVQQQGSAHMTEVLEFEKSFPY